MTPLETHADPLTTTCCIVGCGPAGAMLALLLARAGLDVVVLEKHADFFRDFRGDTIHPSTLQVLDDLGLLQSFEQLPQQRSENIGLLTDEGMSTVADFTTLPGRFRYISFVPQWDFLTFLTDHARRWPGFELMYESEGYALIEEDGAVQGVRYRTPRGPREVRALLTVAADGRHSAIRRAAGLPVREFGAPMDLLWYRVPKAATDPAGSFARVGPGRLLPMIDRRTYWQAAYTMPKGAFAELRARGLEEFRADVRRHLPFLGDRLTDAVRDWDDVGFLEVRVDRLRRWWRPGLLCIGDAAHAMSPIGGVGINLAIQDAVAAANVLAAPLRSGRVEERHLAAVQRRRDLPTRATQALQLAMQRALIAPVLDSRSEAVLPVPLRAVRRFRPLGRLMARFIGVGVRNERVGVGTAPSAGAPVDRTPSRSPHVD